MLLTVAQANAIESARRQQEALAAQRKATGQARNPSGAVTFMQSPNQFQSTPARQHGGPSAPGAASKAASPTGAIGQAATAGTPMNAPGRVGKTPNRTSRQQSSPTAFRKYVRSLQCCRKKAIRLRLRHLVFRTLGDTQASSSPSTISPVGAHPSLTATVHAGAFRCRQQSLDVHASYGCALTCLQMHIGTQGGRIGGPSLLM
jgi:hypothetical protein